MSLSPVPVASLLCIRARSSYSTASMSSAQYDHLQRAIIWVSCSVKSSLMQSWKISSRSAISFVTHGQVHQADVLHLQAGAFDDVIESGNFDGIVHMASPVTVKIEKVEKVVGPAVIGAKSILEATLKHGWVYFCWISFNELNKITSLSVKLSNVSLWQPLWLPLPSRRTGLTRTTMCIPKLYTVDCWSVAKIYYVIQKDWNNYSPSIVEEEGDNAPKLHIYRASKVWAEKAGWKFMEDNKSSIEFDLTTIHPPYVSTIHSATSSNLANLILAGFRRKFCFIYHCIIRSSSSNDSSADAARGELFILDLRHIQSVLYHL